MATAHAKPSALARRVGARLIALGALDEEKYPAERCFIDRKYAPWAERVKGAWCWSLGYLDTDGEVIGGPPFGSDLSVTVVLSWKSWLMKKSTITRGASTVDSIDQDPQEAA